MNRIAETPQRGRGGLGHSATRRFAAAAVLLLAVVAGAQLAGLVGRPAGDPSLSPSAVPSASSPASPRASAATPNASSTTDPSASAAADDDLVLRIAFAGGGPTYPTQYLPWVTLMGDGTLIWQPVPPETEDASLVTRELTEKGLADLREQIFGSGLLDASATHELEPLPGSEPPGRGVGIYFFTAADGGGGQTVVSSVQWLGDDDEATYYQPSPERQELDALAQRLRDPDALLGADAWAGPAEPYEGTDYLLWLTPYRDVPPFDTADASEIPWPFEEPLDEFGAPSGSSPPVTRCAAITRDEAAAIIDALASLGYAQIGLDRATTGSLDWAAGNGTVDVAILPLMPDGFPGCQPQQP